MRKLITTILFIGTIFSASAQTDTIIVNQDTIRLGGFRVITKEKGKEVDIVMGRTSKQRKRNENINTNWLILDAGFNNFIDNTNYALAGNSVVNKPGTPLIDKNAMALNGGKSLNLNIWLFMQRMNLYKHNINLKYGLGVELNNYQFKNAISFSEGGTQPYTNIQTNAPFVFRDSISFAKNKLAADYLTVPFMINFTSDPYSRRKGISGSIGVSAGYLYSQRNKQKSSERGKDTNKGDYGLNKFKVAYIAELGLGPVRLYGSYSPKSMFENGLDFRPYTVGVRFSNW
ncbi:MAG: hypothetical protein KA319_00840 [Ferruginibacter sp.]|nr:hypothetical protein [Ferruginibacter sp.]